MTIKRVIRRGTLHLADWLGLFALSRKLTRGYLRILCYHGASLEDESSFRPGLFMTKQKFETRLRHLTETGYSVISLDEGLRLKELNKLPDGATVITIDDGWYGTYRIMGPLLKEYAFPATLYVASYYMEKQTQVFNVAVAYAMWRRQKARLKLSDVDSNLSGVYDLSDSDEREKAAAIIIDLGKSRPSDSDRQHLFLALCKALALDGESIVQRRIISYMTKDEAEALAKAGVEIQLHTHRHSFPAQYELARKEVEDNRSALAGISGGRLVHFCYPSGQYTTEQIPWLQSMGIESATTVDLGINAVGQSNYELLRILDSEGMSTVEFEAELCGFAHLLRMARRVMRLGAHVSRADGDVKI